MKICPLRFNFEGVYKKECIEKKCGWWNEEAKGCGMRFLKVLEAKK